MIRLSRRAMLLGLWLPVVLVVLVPGMPLAVAVILATVVVMATGSDAQSVGLSLRPTDCDFWTTVMSVLVAMILFPVLLSIVGLSVSSEPHSDLPRLGLLSFSVYAVLVSPLAEELYYRGFLFSAVRSLSNDAVAVVLTSLWFACLHIGPYLDPFQILSTLWCGLILAWVRLRSRSLIPGILAHAALNFIASVSYLVSIAETPS
jgi:membrane protease YdiL (CAAX protease family)